MASVDESPVKPKRVSEIYSPTRIPTHRKKDQARTIRNKKRMLAALLKNKGLIFLSCKRIGINHNTHYDWMKKDEEYNKAVVFILELQVDQIESKFLDNINEGNVQAQIFYLRTKGRNRGYIEKTEIESKNVNLNLSDTKLNEVLDALKEYGN